MQYEWKLISSLEKVFPSDAMPKAQTEGSMLKNEIYSFQLVGTFQNYENFEAYFQRLYQRLSGRLCSLHLSGADRQLCRR